MKLICTATGVGLLTATLAAAPAPALQFQSVITTADQQPLAGVAQIITEPGGGIVAIVAPDNTFEAHLVSHSPAAIGTDAQTLIATGDDYAYFGTAAVSASPALGPVVTFSAAESAAAALFQYRMTTAQTQRLHDPVEHGDYFLTFFDVNATGQALYTSFNAGAGEAARTQMTLSGVVRDVEDRHLDLFKAFNNYIAPNGIAHIVNHPPSGQAREIWASAMNPAIAPSVLVGPGLTVGTDTTDPYKLLGANNTQVLFTALAAAPGGNDAVYLRTDISGGIAYEPLYTGPGVGEDFFATGLLTPGGRASISVYADDGTHLRYWDGSARHDWTFALDTSIQMAAPMIGDGGDWVILYAAVPDTDESLPPLSTILAWNPVLEIDPFVLLQTGGQIELAGEGPVNIADVQMMGVDGLLKDALSDTNDLAVAFRREGSDFFEIAAITLPVPEPTAMTAMIAVAALLRRRRHLPAPDRNTH